MDQTLLLSILSMDAYDRNVGGSFRLQNPSSSATDLGGATLLTTSPSSSDGFFAAAYQLASGQIVISYRGTDQLNLLLSGDVLNGWVIGAGLPIGQAADAVSFYEAIANGYAGDPGATPFNGTVSNITLTGHSLGGGLAGLIGSLTGDATTIFDNMPYAAAAEVLGLFNGQPSPSGNSITAEYVTGEILQAVRLAAPAAAAFATTLGFGPIVAAEATAAALLLPNQQNNLPALSATGAPFDPIKLHSPALATILLYASDEGDTNWTSIGSDFFNALFNDTLAGELGLQPLQGSLVGQGTMSPSEQMMRMIAYSALEGQGLLYGDTGIVSLFKDADLLSLIEKGDDASSTLKLFTPAIADILVEYAGDLAYNSVTQADDPDALDGVLTMSDNGQTVDLDVDPATWDVGGGAPAIYGKKLLLGALLGSFSGGELGLDSALTFTTGIDSVDQVTNIVFATTNAPVNGALTFSSATGSDPLANAGLTLFVLGGGNNNVTGSTGDDFIVGGAGDDTLSAGGGSNVLAGGAGDDTLIAGLGKDALLGGDGNDVIEVNGGYDLVDGGNGFDELEISPQAPAGATSYVIGVSPLLGNGALSIRYGATGSVDFTEVEQVQLAAGSSTVAVQDGALQSTSFVAFQAAPSVSSDTEVLDLTSITGSLTFSNGLLSHGTGSSVSPALGFFGFRTYLLNDADDVIQTNTINSVIDGGGGDDLYLGEAPGTTIELGSGDNTLVWAGDVQVIGLKKTDTITLQDGTQLFGGVRSPGSPNPWAVGQNGMVEYGINQSGDLVIHRPDLEAVYGSNNLGDMFIADWSNEAQIVNGGVQNGPGNITVGNVYAHAYNIMHVPAGSNWLQSQFDLVNTLSRVSNGTTIYKDPLILNLGGGGLDLTAESDGSPHFDYDSTLYAEQTGWVTPDDGILVRVNSDGAVADGRSLFGDETEGGFQALAALDGNGDGVVSAADDGLVDFNGDGSIGAGDTLDALQLWVDANGNGQVDAGELHSLSDYGIVSLNVSSLADGATVAGNAVAATGTFTRGDGSTGELADVDFSVNGEESVYQGPSGPMIPDVLAAPQLKGFGTLSNLQTALSLNPEYIGQIEAALAAITTPDLPTIRDQVLPILLAWADASPIRLKDGTIGTEPVAAPPPVSVWTLNGTDEDYAYSTVDATATVEAQGAYSRTFKFVSGAVIVAYADSTTDLPTIDQLQGMAGSGTIDNALDPGTQTYDVTYSSGGKTIIVTASQSSAAAYATLKTVLTGSYVDGASTYGYHQITSPLLGFIERYLGVDLSSGNDPSSPGAGINFIGALDNASMGLLNEYAVRLAVQAPAFANIFSGISYDVKNDDFVPTTSSQLGPVYAQLLTLAAQKADPYGYLASWKPILDGIIADYAQPSGVENTYAFLAQNILAGYEQSGSALNITQLVDTLGLQDQSVISGAGDLVGTDQQDIFYANAGTTSAAGGIGQDSYIIGDDPGNLTINDYEPPTQGGDDEIRFTSITPGDVTATRDGVDLLLTVKATGSVIRILGEFNGTLPGLGGDGNYAADTGVTDIVFADGTDWTKVDMATAASYVNPNGGVQIGTDATDVMRTGPGNDVLEGGGGSDIYVVDESGGNDVIDDYEDDFERNPVNIVAFAPGIVESDLTFTRVGNSADVTIGFKDSTDTVTIKDQFALTQSGPFGAIYLNEIQNFAFADGTGFGANQLQQMVLEQEESTPGASIYGFDTDDVIQGAGNNYMSGGNGNDTYIFGFGDGADTIQDGMDNILSGQNDTLQFGPGVTRADVTFSIGSTASDLLVTLSDGSTATILGQYDLTNYGFGEVIFNQIENFTFSDGTSLSADDVHALIISEQETAGNDVIQGTNLNDVLQGGLGDDTLSGANGDDTYIYNPDDGNDRIYEGFFGGNDMLSFGAGISPSDLVYTRSGNNLTLSFSDQAGSIYLDNEFAGDGWGVENLSFADGTTWNFNQIVGAYISSEETAGSDVIYGTDATNDVLQGGLGNDALYGGNGDDTYIYNVGDGNDRVFEGYFGGNDTLSFGAEITPQDLIYTVAGTSLTISFSGQSGSIYLDQEFSGEGWGVENFQFADGTSWDLNAIAAGYVAQQIASGANTIYGTDVTDDVLEAGRSATLVGGGGNDIYVYNPGDGDQRIYEGANDGQDVLQLGAGITVAGTVLTRAGNDILLTFTGQAGSIFLENELGGSQSGVETITFSDGTTWSQANIANLVEQQAIVGSPTATSLAGSPGPDLFDPAGYATYAQGNGGEDTFLYNPGYGQVELNDDSGDYVQAQAILQLGGGINATNLSVSGDANGDLVLTDGTAGDVIKVDGELLNGPWGYAEYGVGSVVFADGESLSRAQLIGLATTGTSANTRLYGTPGAETLDPKGFATYEQGNGGADTYVYDTGYGAVEIEADNGYGSGSTSLLQLGAGITLSNLTISNDGSGDLILADGVSGDQVKLDGEFDNGPWGNPEYGVQSIGFADGDTLSRSQLITLTTTGSPTNTRLYGTPGSDTFEAAGYARYEQGNGGADTFTYDAGYGQLEINEDNGYGSPSTATLQLGSAISAADLTLANDGAGDLILTDAISGDRVKIDGEFTDGPFGNPEYGVQTIELANGVQLSRQQLIDQTTIGSPGNTRLFGTPGADSFDPKGFATYEQGNGGADTFLYDPGYGQVEINDDVGYGASASAMVQLGAGTTAANLTIGNDGQGDLILTDGTSGDRIKIDNEFNRGPHGDLEYGVQTVTFADGTSLDYQQLLAATTTGSTTNTRLFGTSAGQLFDSRGLATYEQGGGGADSFVYDAGYGQLEINENSADGDTSGSVLELSPGITQSDLVVTEGGAGNLLLADGTTGDQIQLDGVILSTQYGVAAVSFADGSSLTLQQLIALDTNSVPEIFGSPSDTSLTGTAKAEVFDPGGYASYALGNGGADTFIYDSGYGQFRIREDSGLSTSQAVLQMGAGITASQLQVTENYAGDMEINDGVAGDQIQVDGQFWTGGSLGAEEWGVQAITFADGTELDRQQLFNLTLQGSPSQTALYGSANADTFDSKGYATYEQGNGGADTFLYNAGYGQLRIREDSGAAVSAAVLQFGPGITASQLQFTQDGNENLDITDTADGVQIQVDGEFYPNGYYGQLEWGISTVAFADGTQLTRQQIVNLTLQGSSTNTNLYGTAAADKFDSKGFATYEQGNGGADTFIYNAGYGQLRIREDSGTATSSAILQFGAGITASQLQFTQDGNDNLDISDTVTGDHIQIDGEYYPYGNYGPLEWGVAALRFADGTTLTRQQITNAMLVGSPTNTRLYGTGLADTFDPNGYASYAQGNGGADTFLYNLGYGNVEINEDAGFRTPTTAILQLASGFTQANTSITFDRSGNVFLTDGDAGDLIRLDNEVALGDRGIVEYGVSAIAFADGTMITQAQLFQDAVTGSSTNTALYGTMNAEVIDAEGMATYAQGNGGADTFVYDRGYGQLEIREDAGYLTPTQAVLQLGGGLTAADMSVTFDRNGTAYLSDGTAGDQIQLDAEVGLGSGDISEYGVGAITFADGTSITQAQLAQMAVTGSPTNTALYGTDKADLLDSRGYATYEQGNGGADTFVYAPGYGQLEVREDAGFRTNTQAALQVGGGLTAADFSATFDSRGDVFLTDGMGCDQIQLDGEVALGYADADEYGVADVSFADGTSITQASLAEEALIGSPTNTSLYGTDKADVFDSRGFATYELGNGGADSYIFDRGYGQLTINTGGNSGPMGEVDFGSDVTEEDLWFQQSGSSLVVDVLGTTDQITLQNWYSSDGSKVQSFESGDAETLDYSSVDQLVQAMATYTANNPGFAAATASIMPTDATLQSAIAAAWHH